MVEWPTVVALVVAGGTAAYSVYRDRRRPALLTREQQLEAKVRELEGTVKVLLADRAAAQEQIDKLRVSLDKAEGRIRVLEAEQGQVKPGGSAAGRDVVLAAIGDDAALQVDLAALRKVQSRTGLRLTRLLPVTRANLERTLDRHRKAGRPVRFVHASVHAGPQGLLFADGLADGPWCSEHLKDVDVLVLAGCESDVIGDWAGIVPAVVSLREKAPHNDAAIFCEVFWMGIGEGLQAADAFERALERSPQSLAEYAELHE